MVVLVQHPTDDLKGDAHAFYFMCAPCAPVRCLARAFSALLPRPPLRPRPVPRIGTCPPAPVAATPADLPPPRLSPLARRYGSIVLWNFSAASEDRLVQETRSLFARESYAEPEMDDFAYTYLDTEGAKPHIHKDVIHVGRLFLRARVPRHLWRPCSKDCRR